ncbi:hypothetical protein EYF80_039934 [Liparis tanakae]|uniref:Uncharacterized protein n=1 Tax=Liparis tanakae TaxID=230148 RepID=A0A4Z2GB32_9TELE|nr:hypothetical protein EYF80_039934 [Liparis tanakae]
MATTIEHITITLDGFKRYPGGEKINRLRIRCPRCHISSPLTLNSALLRTADHLRGDQTLSSPFSLYRIRL